MATSFTVLIPTHGRPTLLGRTLASLGACRLPEGYRETVVIENGSRDGAEAVVEEIAESNPELRLRYMHVEWGNKSHALNEALKTVEDGLVVFFDDDVRLEPGVLTAYSKAVIQGGYYFGGPVEPDFEVAPPAWRLEMLPASVKGWRGDRGGLEAEHPFLGFNWAAFSSDLKRAGGFDPNRGPGSPTRSTGQESDMQQRLQELGVQRRYVSEALVWHYVPQERCSIRWSLDRSFRTGIEQGITRGSDALGVHQSVGAFRVAIVARTVGLVGKYFLRFDKRGVWHAVYYGWRSMGVARGVAQASANASLPPGEA